MFSGWTNPTPFQDKCSEEGKTASIEAVKMAFAGCVCCGALVGNDALFCAECATYAAGVEADAADWNQLTQELRHG